MFPFRPGISFLSLLNHASPIRGSDAFFWISQKNFHGWFLKLAAHREVATVPGKRSPYVLHLQHEISLKRRNKRPGPEMQWQMGNLQEELRKTQEELYEVEEERDRVVDELKEMKKLAQEANMRLSEALCSKRSGELYTELSAAKKSLSDATRELHLKDKIIESMRLELEKAQLVERKLAERDEAVEKLKKELNAVKIAESHAVESLSESKTRVQELEEELDRKEDSEAKVFDSLVSQTKQLEQTKILHEESKLEMASLREKVMILEDTSGQRSQVLGLPNNNNSYPENSHSRNEELEALRSELHQMKENLGRARTAEQLASLNAQSVLQEMGLLKSELELALEAEEKSKKAMDDLALALSEVAAETNQAKEKLSSLQIELENKRAEAEQLRQALKSTENKYQALLDEARKEAETHRNAAELLRLEAEESLVAWNLKETEFINCMKEAEKEKIDIQKENSRLAESVKAADEIKRASREENHKLRDILKQAINESTVAKEAAAIARAENSQLKDSLAEKEEALDYYSRENERLRVSESAAQENIKELKYLLSTASAKHAKTDDEEVAGAKPHKPLAKVKTEDKEVAEVKPHKTPPQVKTEDNEIAEVKSNKPPSKAKTDDKEVAEAKPPKTTTKEVAEAKPPKTTTKEVSEAKPPTITTTKEVPEANPPKTTSKEAAEVKPPKTTSKEAAEVKPPKTTAKEKTEEKEVAEVKNHQPIPKPKAEDKEGADIKASKPHLGDPNERRKSRNTFSFDFEELKAPIMKPKDEDEEFLIEEALKGSIFDTESPPVAASHHRKMPSCMFSDDGELTGSEDFDHLDGQHLDDADHERSSHRKKKALLRRFGDLIMRRSFYQRAGIIEQRVPD